MAAKTAKRSSSNRKHLTTNMPTADFNRVAAKCKKAGITPAAAARDALIRWAGR